MRATINFDIDVEKVEDTMATLVAQEAGTIRVAANILENLGHSSLLEEVNETIDLLHEAATQLQQYQRMLLSFERAKFETVAPQPAGQPVHSLGDLRNVVDNMKRFDGFLEQVNNVNDPELDDESTKEG